MLQILKDLLFSNFSNNRFTPTVFDLAVKSHFVWNILFTFSSITTLCSYNYGET